MADTSSVALPQGYALNEYRIESTLGVGGFGLTYLATDTNLNLRVALKEYLPGQLALRAEDSSVQPRSNDEADSFQWGLDRFLDESRTLASFRHPNIVRVMRYFKANSTAYMVMEFVDGRALPDWMRAHRPVSETALRAILLPLLDGLGVVHRSGFLHRDIKPGNVFIRDDGSPVLLDFGSARMAKENTELTAIVTPGYAPLEQYHTHGKQGPWSDLYALGGVLYWMTTGLKPVEAAARVRDDPMPPALQAADRGRYSSELLTVIDWMLSPNEAQRPQSVLEVAASLKTETVPGTETIDPTRTGAFDRPAPPAAPAAGAAPAESTSRPVSAPFSTPLDLTDRDTRRKIETELTAHIGPIAPVVIRNAAKKCTTLAELVNTVAAEISDDAARAKFIRRFAHSDASQPVSGRPPEAPSATTMTNVATRLAEQRFDPKTLGAAEAMLASHIGPLARVVVKRAAMKARDAAELYLLIADEIDDPAQRKAFIRKALSKRD
jgi:serine/threonine protein kinase